jgi:hypothetical protein
VNINHDGDCELCSRGPRVEPLDHARAACRRLDPPPLAGQVHAPLEPKHVIDPVAELARARPVIQEMQRPGCENGSGSRADQHRAPHSHPVRADDKRPRPLRQGDSLPVAGPCMLLGVQDAPGPAWSRRQLRADVLITARTRARETRHPWLATPYGPRYGVLKAPVSRRYPTRRAVGLEPGRAGVLAVYCGIPYYSGIPQLVGSPACL